MTKVKSKDPSKGPSAGLRKFVIYHNPRCVKSREVYDRLKRAGVALKVVEYMKTPILPDELDVLLKQMHLQPAEVLRIGEDRYRDLDLENAAPKSRKAWIRLLVENPVLLERPIVSDGQRAVLARPADKVDVLLATD